MENVGTLIKTGDRYEYRHDPLSLVVRGDYPEWVLSAAAELISVIGQRDCESRIEELETLVAFEEAEGIALDSARFEKNARFEIMPQCTITMGTMDYRWVASEGRKKLAQEFDGQPIRRVHDMSMTRNDTFLVNEDGVDTSNG